MKEAKIFYLVCFILLAVGFVYDNFLLGIYYQNDLLIEFMSWLSYIGTGFFVLVFMTSLFLWYEKKRKWILPLWISMALTLFLVFLMKISIGRARPEDALLFYSTYSFPSAHAATVFSGLAILDQEIPKLKWFWFAFAVLVSFSRLYLGVHYLTDVIAGALIGYSIGFLTLYAFNRRFKHEKRRK